LIVRSSYGGQARAHQDEARFEARGANVAEDRRDQHDEQRRLVGREERDGRSHQDLNRDRKDRKDRKPFDEAAEVDDERGGRREVVRARERRAQRVHAPARPAAAAAAAAARRQPRAERARREAGGRGGG
jgi:hypothetical protein